MIETSRSMRIGAVGCGGSVGAGIVARVRRSGHPARLRLASLVLVALATVAALLPVTASPTAFGIPGLTEARLTPDYWIERADRPDRMVLDRDAIAARNLRLRTLDASQHDLAALPSLIDAARVTALLRRVSVTPAYTLYDDTGKAGTPRQVARIVANADLDRIPETQVLRFGLVVRRADLRSFPTRLQVSRAPDDLDIDRFQETALFPGTPVAIVHESRDRAWYFVVSPGYAAWIEKQHVAVGERSQVLGYGTRTPSLVVTGARAETVFTPERPEVSTLRLEMGVRVPRLADWPADRPVNGQHPLAGHVVELPVRDADGRLAFAPALVPRTAEVADDVLPLTRGNLIRQAFRFLGERYGWGHGFQGRDCSGFVSEVYRSVGVEMPRNTGDQAVTPAFDRVVLTAADDRARRLQLLREAHVGDLLYIPGHVMLLIGHVDGAPWVIHDTAGIHLRADDGGVRRLALNGVVVTPLLPMLGADGVPVVDAITNIQRIRP